MENIKITHSMAIDTLCFIDNINLEDRDYMFDNEIEMIEKLRGMLPEDFGENAYSMSAMSLIISTYTENRGLETLDLDGMISIFENMDDVDKVVRERTTDDFTGSYLFDFLDSLKNGIAQRYVWRLKKLREIGYEEIYKNEVLPGLQMEIDKYSESVAKHESYRLLDAVSRMKKQNLDSARIYVSFFSCPVCFSIYGGAYVTQVLPNMLGGKTLDPGKVFMELSSHELMHGFASAGNIAAYRDYVKSDPYLEKGYSHLTNDLQEGDEEEFVVAAELYLNEYLGFCTHEQAMARAKSQYDGCCHIAVMLFDILSKRGAFPEDYNKVLEEIFTSGVLPRENVEEYVESLK